MNARGSTRPTQARQKLAVSNLIFSVVILVGALASLVLQGFAPAGNPGSALLRYMLLAVGALGVAYSVYLLRPGVAQRFDRRTAEWLAMPAVGRLHRLRNQALVALAVLLLVEIPLALALLSLPGGWIVAAGVIGGTILVLVGMVAAMIQIALGKAP